MKSGTWAVVLTVTVVICVFLSLWLLQPDSDAEIAEIWSAGELKYTLELSVDREVTVVTDRGSNTITVRNGEIAVTAADCPDHYCMARGYCSAGNPIICLPNQLVIRFLGTKAVDAVAQ